MTERWKRIVAAVILAGMVGLPVSGAGQDGDVVGRVTTREVLLPVTVRTSDGHIAGGLDARDFIVIEEGMRQEVTGVRYPPLRLLFLLDASWSFFSVLKGRTLAAEPTTEKALTHEKLREALIRMTDDLSPRDQVCLMQFAGGASVIEDWTDSQEKIERAITWSYKANPATGKETHFWDALAKACDKMAEVKGRRAIVLVTDCYGIGGDTTPEAVEEKLQRTGASLFVVSTALAAEKAPKQAFYALAGGLGGERIDSSWRQGQAVAKMKATEARLETIARKTGGDIFRCLDRTNLDLPETLARAADDIGGQYLVTYLPSNESPNPPYRRVVVKLAKPGLTAATREGYYVEATERKQ